jgi:hypothetical protein
LLNKTRGYEKRELHLTIAVVLQNIVEDRKLFLKGIDDDERQKTRSLLLLFSI